MKKKQSESKIFDIIIYSMMAIAVLYVLIQTKIGNNNEMYYKISLGIWIIAALVINDFVEPKVRGRFEQMKEYKLQIYLMYAITDAAAYGALYLFIVNIGFFQEPIHYLFLGIALILFLVRARLERKYKSLTDGASQIIQELKDKPGYLEEEVIEDDNFEVNTLDEEDDMKVFIVREKRK